MCSTLYVSHSACVPPSLCPFFRVYPTPCMSHSLCIPLLCIRLYVSHSVYVPLPVSLFLSYLPFLCLPPRVSIPLHIPLCVCIRLYIPLLVRPTPYFPTLCVLLMCLIPSVFPSPSLPNPMSHSLGLLLPIHFREISHSPRISHSLYVPLLTLFVRTTSGTARSSQWVM